MCFQLSILIPAKSIDPYLQPFLCSLATCFYFSACLVLSKWYSHFLQSLASSHSRVYMLLTSSIPLPAPHVSIPTIRPDPIFAEFAPQSICLHQCTSFFPSLQSPLLFSFVAPFLLPNPVMLGCLDCSIETRIGLSRTNDVPAYEPRRCSRRYIINSSKARLSTGTNPRLLHLKNLNTLRRRPSLKRRSVLTTRRYCVFWVPDALEPAPAAPRQFCCASPNFRRTATAGCKCRRSCYGSKRVSRTL